MKKAIVNLVTKGKLGYLIAQERLKDSLENNFDGDAFFYKSEEEVGAPPHEENPYAFKIYAIEKVRDLGYDLVLWVDASVVAVKNVQPVFDWIKKKGLFMEEAGHWAGTWSNENALNYFSITRDEAMKMPMYSAGFSGFDFTNPIAIEFFNEWKQAMVDGIFKGEWSDFRHDMTCGSIIANKIGLLSKFSSGGTFFGYVGEGYAKPKESTVFHLLGV